MNKKELIMNCSIDIFVEYGFHGAPVTKLISNAGVSNGTFFYYFKTKEDLITDIYVLVKNDLYETLKIARNESSSIKIQIESLWMTWLNWGIVKNKEFRFIELFANSPFINKIKTEEVQTNYLFIKELIAVGIEKEILINRDVSLLSELIYGNIQAAIRYNQKNHQLSDVEKKDIFEILWKCISLKS